MSSPITDDEGQEIVRALLELFSEIDTLFSEEGSAFEKARMSLGRVHRAWKRCRVVLDPEFNPKRYARKRYGT